MAPDMFFRMGDVAALRHTEQQAAQTEKKQDDGVGSGEKQRERKRVNPG